MAAVNFPLLCTVDDSGAIVTGATVSITSVKDVDGTDIASHGAVLHTSGSNISVEYDPETKGEAWIVLAISKAATTITGLNAAPRFYLARDSGRIDLVKAKTDQIAFSFAGGLDANVMLVRGDANAAVGIGDIGNFYEDNNFTMPETAKTDAYLPVSGAGSDTIVIDGDSVNIT